MKVIKYYITQPNATLLFFYKLVVFLNAILLFGEVLSYNDIKDWTPMNLKIWTFTNLVFVAIFLLLDFDSQRKNLQHPIFKWIVFFLIINCIWGYFTVIFGGQYAENGDYQFRQNMVAILNVFCLFILIYHESVFEFARRCILWLSLFCAVMNIYDFTSVSYTHLTLPTTPYV